MVVFISKTFGQRALKSLQTKSNLYTGFARRATLAHSHRTLDLANISSASGSEPNVSPLLVSNLKLLMGAYEGLGALPSTCIRFT